MYSQTRLVLRKTHDFVDALIAKILGGKTLGELSEECLDKMSILENIDSFAYAKKSHFQHLEIPAMYAKQSLKTADMKAYQDSLILTFIKQNIKPAAKILEIGGGGNLVLSNCCMKTTLSGILTSWKAQALAPPKGPTMPTDMCWFKIIWAHSVQNLKTIPSISSIAFQPLNICHMMRKH